MKPYFFLWLTIALATFNQNGAAQPFLPVDLPKPNWHVTSVTAIAEAANGDLYIGTNGGLLIKTSTGFNYDMIDSVADATGNYRPIKITCVEIVRGKVWVGTEAAGAYFLNNGQWVNFTVADGLPSNTVRAISEGGPQYTWMACDGGVARYNGSIINIYRPFSNNQIIELVAYHGGFLYASNHRRNEPIKKFSGSIWTSIDSIPPALGGVGQNRAQQILFSSGNKLTIRTSGDNRVLHFDGQNWSGVYHNSVLGIAKNPAGIDILQVQPDMHYLTYTNGTLDTIASGLAPAADMAKPAIGGGFWLGGSTGTEPLLSYVKGTTNNFGTLNANTIKADFSSYGSLFEKDRVPEFPSYYRFFFTDTAKKGLAYFSALWLKGSINGQTRLSATNAYINGSRDFMSGPITQVYNAEYLEKFDRVWQVNKAAINHHRNHYATQGYKVPESIKSWPGNGDSALGTAAILAPFVDMDADGVYDPAQGDYPQIKGDQAVFFMFNDLRGKRNLTSSQPLQVEIHGMAYAYDTNHAVLEKSIFINYKIINRSGQVIKGLKPGHYTSTAISTSNIANLGGNDALGSDNKKNLVYHYNATSHDPIYGFQSPAFGIVSLSDSLIGNIGFELYPATTVSTGSPESFVEFNNILNSKWKDGSSLIIDNPSGFGSSQNGNGYSASGSGLTTSFHYDYNQNWFKSPQTAATSMSVSAYASADLQPGEFRCLDLAFTVTPSQGANTQLAMINTLRAAADSLKSFYLTDSTGCLEYKISLPENKSTRAAGFSVYPNPAQAELNLKVAAGVKIKSIAVFALSGRKVLQTTSAVKINVEGLSSGIYFIQLETNIGLLNERFIKE